MNGSIQTFEVHIHKHLTVKKKGEKNPEQVEVEDMMQFVRVCIYKIWKYIE
jgi:hypothetical protein